MTSSQHRIWSLIAACALALGCGSALDPVLASKPDYEAYRRTRIADTLEANSVPEAVVVGHSLGGFVAVEYARAHTSSVRAAVNVDGFWWGRPGEYPGAEQVGELLRSTAGIVAPPGYIEEQVADAARQSRRGRPIGCED